MALESFYYSCGFIELPPANQITIPIATLKCPYVKKEKNSELNHFVTFRGSKTNARRLAERVMTSLRRLNEASSFSDAERHGGLFFAVLHFPSFLFYPAVLVLSPWFRSRSYLPPACYFLHLWARRFQRPVW